MSSPDNEVSELRAQLRAAELRADTLDKQLTQLQLTKEVEVARWKSVAEELSKKQGEPDDEDDEEDDDDDEDDDEMEVVLNAVTTTSSSSARVDALRQEITECREREQSANVRAREASAKLSELRDMDHFLASVAENATADETMRSVHDLIEEYLNFYDFRHTLECFGAESKCSRFGVSSQGGSAAAEREKAYRALLRHFDRGETDLFLTCWQRHVPPTIYRIVSATKIGNRGAVSAIARAGRRLLLRIHAHFIVYELRRRVAVVGDSSAGAAGGGVAVAQEASFPATPQEAKACEHLLEFLSSEFSHAGSQDGGGFDNDDNDLLLYFALPTMPHPESHPELQQLFKSSHTASLRRELESFLAHHLPSARHPKIVALYQMYAARQSLLLSRASSACSVAAATHKSAMEALSLAVLSLGDPAAPEQSSGRGDGDDEAAAGRRERLSGLYKAIHAHGQAIATLTSSLGASEPPPPPELDFGRLQQYLLQRKDAEFSDGQRCSLLSALTARLRACPSAAARAAQACALVAGDVLCFAAGEDNVLHSCLSVSENLALRCAAGGLSAALANFPVGRSYLEGGGALAVLWRSAAARLFESALPSSWPLPEPAWQQSCLQAVQRVSVDRAAGAILAHLGALHGGVALLHGGVLTHRCTGAASATTASMATALVFNLATVPAAVEHAAAVCGGGTEQLQAQASGLPEGGIGVAIAEIVVALLSRDGDEPETPLSPSEDWPRCAAQLLAALYLLLASEPVRSQAAVAGISGTLRKAAANVAADDERLRRHIECVLSRLDETNDNDDGAESVPEYHHDSHHYGEVQELDSMQEIALLPSSVEADVSDGARLLLGFRKTK